jgi:hypothetical protein
MALKLLRNRFRSFNPAFKVSTVARSASGGCNEYCKSFRFMHKG